MQQIILLGSRAEKSQIIKMIAEKYREKLGVICDDRIVMNEKVEIQLIATSNLSDIYTKDAVLFVGNKFPIGRLRHLTRNNFVIVNSANTKQIEKLSKLGVKVITVGNSSKDTVSISSVNENSVVVALQRTIKFGKSKVIEPMEISYQNENNYDIYCVLAFITISMMLSGE